MSFIGFSDIYSQWTNSPDYQKQSFMENGEYDKVRNYAENAVGEKEYRKICDEVCDIGCDAERCGFEYGFRYGVSFLHEALLKGGDLHE